MYASADEWKPVPGAAAARNELDRWILSRLQRMVSAAREALDNFEHFRLIEAFQSFNEEFSNWYLRRSRRRFWTGDADAYQTLFTALETVTRLMAGAAVPAAKRFIRTRCVPYSIRPRRSRFT